MVFCIYCGSSIDDSANFCPKCGKETAINPVGESKIESDTTKVKKLQRPIEWKSEAITVILGIVLTGLGHFYINHFKRGGIFFGIGIVLLILSFVNEFIAIVSIPFWIFTVYDAYKQCKIYNKHLEETGKKKEW